MSATTQLFIYTKHTLYCYDCHKFFYHLSDSISKCFLVWYAVPNVHDRERNTHSRSIKLLLVSSLTSRETTAKLKLASNITVRNVVNIFYSNVSHAGIQLRGVKTIPTLPVSSKALNSGRRAKTTRWLWVKLPFCFFKTMAIIKTPKLYHRVLVPRSVQDIRCTIKLNFLTCKRTNLR